MKTTQWFDGAKYVPGSVGIYERDLPVDACSFGGVVMYFWTGKYWCTRLGHTISYDQNLPWRGLIEQAK